MVALLIIPIAYAQWLVSVDANPFSAELFVVSSSQGCIYVLEGDVRAIYEFNGSTFVPIDLGRTICSSGNDIFRVVMSPNAYIQLPEAEIVPRDVFLSNVKWKTIGGRVFLSITPITWPLLIIPMMLAGIIVFLLRRKRVEKDRCAAIIEYIAQHPGCTQKDICSALGLEKYQVSRILSRLEKEGKIIRVRRGISKRVYLPEQFQ